MSEGFLRTYRYLLGLTFFLIAFGASVRAMDAGLACPDWPLCFGDVIPDFQVQVYFEFLHRAIAGIVALLTVGLHFLVIRKRELPANLRILAWFSLMLLATQVILGGLTVLLQLQEEVVAAHLSMGTAFFGTLCWIYFSLRYEKSPLAAARVPGFLGYLAPLSMVAVYMQIVLGGFVASHYAALVCVDFPTCHGKLIPTFQGIIGLQVIHRLGAYALTIVLLCYAGYILLNVQDRILKKMSWAVLALILTQVAIGIANVVFLRPPIITVLHLAAGTALLGLTIFMSRRVSYLSTSR